MARFFPFMLLAVIAYGVTVAALGIPLSRELVSLGLPSGSAFTLTVSELLLTFATIVLFFELVSAASTKSRSLLSHGLSMVVFIACGLIFLFVPGFGTGTFVIITLMSLVDVIAGYSISILTARRDMILGNNE